MYDIHNTHPHWHQTRHYLIPEVSQLLRKCLDKGGGLGQLVVEVFHFVLLWFSIIRRAKGHATKSREPLQVWRLALVERQVRGETNEELGTGYTPTRHTLSTFSRNKASLATILFKHFFQLKLVTANLEQVQGSYVFHRHEIFMHLQGTCEPCQ